MPIENVNNVKVSPLSKRVFGLDLFRSLAILSVMYGHGQMSFLPPNLVPAGVEWFFVLSGFLIGQIILRDFKEGVSWKELSFFLKRRWYRTLPNYYFFLFLNVLLAYWGLNGSDFHSFDWKFLFFLQNFWEPFVNFFWESWSLSIEEWFYILFPFTCFFILRSKQFSSKRSFAISIALLIFIPLLIKLICSPSIQADEFWFDSIFRKLVPFRLDSIIFGVLIAFFKVYYPSLWINKKRFAIPLLILAIVYLQINSLMQYDLEGIFARVFKFPFQSLALACLLPFFDQLGSAPSFLTKPIEWISKISYSLYLAHFGVVLGLMKNYPEYFGSPSEFFFLLTYWLTSFLIASVVYYYFERPFTNLRPTKI